MNQVPETLYDRCKALMDEYSVYRVSGLIYVRKKGEPLPVVWLKKVNGKNGKELHRIACGLISADDTWGTVEYNGQRTAVLLSDLTYNPASV